MTDKEEPKREQVKCDCGRKTYHVFLLTNDSDESWHVGKCTKCGWEDDLF